MLGQAPLATSIPHLLVDTLDTFPEEILLQVLDVPGLDFRSTVAAIAGSPSPSHTRVHRLIARRALAGEFDPWFFRDVAKALRAHPRAPLLKLVQEECQSGEDKQMWLIRKRTQRRGNC